jgi:Phosphatidylethanolamine-binding protein
LRAWAHMLGFRGHWSTKSRRYSTTFTVLRRPGCSTPSAARPRAASPLDAWGRPEEDQAVVMVASRVYVGAGYETEGEHPAGAVEGRNDFGEQGYGGPMPPVGGGPHRYFFRVVAASAPLGLTAAPSAEDLRRALEGKELASGTLVGTYQR